MNKNAKKLKMALAKTKKTKATFEERKLQRENMKTAIDLSATITDAVDKFISRKIAKLELPNNNVNAQEISSSVQPELGKIESKLYETILSLLNQNDVDVEEQQEFGFETEDTGL